MPYDPKDPKYARVLSVVAHRSRDHLLRTLRTDSLPILREQAAFALAEYTGVEVEDALGEALTDVEAKVRHAAAETLLITGRERGLRRLAEIAETFEWPSLIRRLVSQTAADPNELRPGEWLWPRSLSLVEGPALDALCDELRRPHPETRGIVRAALVYIGDPVVEPLCRALEGSGDTLDFAATQVLADIGSARSIQVLREYVERENWKLSACAAMALARSGPSALSVLKELLTSSSSQHRQVMAAALCVTSHPRVFEALEVLGADALPALSEVLSKGSEEVRNGAALALGRLGLREALPMLRMRLPRLGVGGERDPDALAAVREAIRQIESATQEARGLPRAASEMSIDPAGRPRAGQEGSFRDNLE